MQKLNRNNRVGSGHTTARVKSILLYAACLMTGLSASTYAEEVIIHAGYLIEVPGNPIREKVSIVTENGKIKAVKEGFIKGAKTIDLSKSYVLPGLIDMHTHVTIDSELHVKHPQQTLINGHLYEKSKLALDALPLIKETLLAGFTTVRNLGDPSGVIFDLRDAVNQGIIDGPRILAAKTQISVSSGGYDPAKLGVRAEVVKTFEAGGLCDGPYECRRTVRRLVAEGADVIKLRIVDGSIFTDEIYEYQDELEAIIDTAHKLGRRVAAHVGSEKASLMVLQAGADTIEHGGPLSKEALPLAKKAYLTPTLYAFKALRDLFIKVTGRDMYAEALKRTNEAYKAGVPILFGSDSGAFQQKEATKEFGVLIEAGLSPVDALKSATVTAAKALDLSHLIGTVEEGKSADIIATTENPLKNITTLEKVTFVMKGGKVYL